MRLFLTSNAFPNEKLREAFFKLVGKEAATVRLAFIPTASDLEKDRSFSYRNREELEEMGLLPEHIVTVELDHLISPEELQAFDVLYVDGGNTFYLLKKIRESGFDIALADYLKEDRGVYVGGSAGTLVMGPDIELAEPWDDRSVVERASTEGLGYTEAVWCPHYRDEEMSILESYRKRVSYPIRELRDGEAVVVVGGREGLIR